MNSKQLLAAVQKYEDNKRIEEAKKILADISSGRTNLFPNPSFDLGLKTALIPVDPSVIEVFMNETLPEAVTRVISRILQIRPEQITNVTLEQTYEESRHISSLRNYGSYARPVTQARVEYWG